MPECAATVEDHYCRMYVQALDSITTAINDHFSQPDYAVYAMCEELLLCAVYAMCEELYLCAVNGKDTEPMLAKEFEFLKMTFQSRPSIFSSRH